MGKHVVDDSYDHIPQSCILEDKQHLPPDVRAQRMGKAFLATTRHWA